MKTKVGINRAVRKNFLLGLFAILNVQHHERGKSCVGVLAKNLTPLVILYRMRN
jgi:hypothetical protein